MGRSVLVAWELGGGYGHHYRMSALADGVRDAGSRVTIAAPGGRERLAPVIGEHVALDAPIAAPPPRHFPLSVSYAGNLLRNGWWHGQTLRATVGGWLDLFDRVSPNHLIAEHAPAAVVAARIANLPCTMVGTGFTVPPDMSPLPSLHPWLAIPAALLERTERDFLDAVAPLCATYGFDPPTSVSRLFGRADRLACCDPETDHYESARRPAWLGPVIETARGDTARGEEAAATAEPEIFVYLKAANRFVEPMLAAVAATGRPALAHIPGLSATDCARLSTRTLTVAERPVDLTTVAPSCRLAVTDAGFNTAAFFLDRGVPLLCCPGWLEQACLAWHLAQRGLARTFNFTTARPNCAAGLGAALADTETAQTVQAFAARRPRRDTTAEIVARVLGPSATRAAMPAHA